uniref:DDE_Tnp_ISL3 domain-containing protein n=1 Tax=Heterorhabditis bacteriophora TaxID=37862 RepID=A0A1I7W9U2_HETBA
MSSTLYVESFFDRYNCFILFVDRLPSETMFFTTFHNQIKMQFSCTSIVVDSLGAYLSLDKILFITKHNYPHFEDSCIQLATYRNSGIYSHIANKNMFSDSDSDRYEEDCFEGMNITVNALNAFDQSSSPLSDLFDQFLPYLFYLFNFCLTMKIRNLTQFLGRFPCFVDLYLVPKYLKFLYY